MENMKLCPPWVEYANKIKKLFEKDNDIKVDYNDSTKVITLFVESEEKSDALNDLLPVTKDFGGTEIRIKIVPSNNSVKDNRYYIKKLFNGNEAVTNIQDVTGVMTNPLTYVEFEKKVVQFWNDNLGDLNGNKSMVMEDIAREVFEGINGVLFCTSSQD